MSRAPLGGALAATVVVALALAGCGTKSQTVHGTGSISWTKKPDMIRLGSRPNDRILFGEVRNDSLRPIRIKATDVRVVNADGTSLASAAIFSRSFAHGLYGSTDPRARAPGDFELTRLGRLVLLKPGEKAPLTVSWRLRRAGQRPVQVQLGDGALPIP